MSHFLVDILKSGTKLAKEFGGVNEEEEEEEIFEPEPVSKYVYEPECQIDYDYLDKFGRGYGRCSYLNGDRYEGNLSNGNPEGRGLYNYASGDKYYGDFQYGRRYGRGKYTYKNGDFKNGTFSNRKFKGYGNITEQGDRYTGDIYYDVKEGQGKIQYKNGDVYQGEFKNDLPDGHGVFLNAISGDKYNGQMKNGLFHGLGTLTKRDGKQIRGTFRMGRLHGVYEVKYPDDTVRDERYYFGMGPRNRHTAGGTKRRKSNRRKQTKRKR